MAIFFLFYPVLFWKLLEYNTYNIVAAGYKCTPMVRKSKPKTAVGQSRFNSFAKKYLLPIPDVIKTSTGLNLGLTVLEVVVVFVAIVIFLLWNSIFVMGIVKGNNALFSYVLSQFSSQKPYWYYWLAGFIVMVGYLVRKNYVNLAKSKSKKTNRLKALKLFGSSLLLIVLLVVFCLGVGFAAVYAAGVVHTNILLANINKGGVGDVVWGKEKIQSRLESLDQVPIILESTKENLDKDIANIYLKNSGLSDYYQKQVIAVVPNSLLIKTSIPKDSMLMVKNYLFVNEIKDDEIQQVSPVLGYKLVKAHFGGKYIKSYPEVKVLGRQDYLKFREEQINKRVKAIEEVLADVKKQAAAANGALATARDKVAYYGNLLSVSSYAREEDYNYCVSLGSYYPEYTPSTCRTYVDQYWNAVIQKAEQEKRNWEGSLGARQREATYWNGLSSYVSEVKNIVEGQKDTIPYELGVFHDDNKIEIALDETNSKSIYPYTATLVHEYMHYTSHVSNERAIPLFFEESLTEYYARKVIQGNTNQDSQVGYPVLVKLIERMLEKVDAKKLEDVYFTKDQKALEALLEENYGKEFYEKNKLNFDILPFLSGEEQVKTANEIIEKIGGEKFKVEDFK
ncbi:MAG: hypothetical protein AAB546_00685 [Patescibacteria group bacterium]